MSDSKERIVVVEPDDARRESLRALLEGDGYAVAAFAAPGEGLAATRTHETDLFLLSALSGAIQAHGAIAAIRGSAATEEIRILLIVSASAAERSAALDLGADDAISEPFDTNELVARVRAQLRVRRADSRLLARTRLAEEGQQIAQTAFEALAVTEKMASDASRLDRRLKIGLGAVFAAVVVMAAIYFLLARSAQKDMQRTTATIMRLERGLVSQQSLIAEVRKAREEQGAPAETPADKETLQKQAADLEAQILHATPDQVGGLQKQLEDTNALLSRIEQEGTSPENFILADVPSVCLLHVAVGFRNQSGEVLRYAGLNSDGEPIQDSDGNPVLTIGGRGPEVVLDVFGTGFVAGEAGRVITNRHVAEPWWNNEDLGDLTAQGFRPQIASIRAYFPGDPRAFHAEIQEISQDADLATMRVDMQDLKRPILSIDSTKAAAATGEPIVLMGYATGLAAILARTDEKTAQEIVMESGGDISKVLDELARRNLIRPIITQGHIGDVLQDKIVFDAQTTSGGSGGPLFNQQGKVVGVTFAVLKGFGGSNFGIPIRFSEPLLAQTSSHSAN